MSQPGHMVLPAPPFRCTPVTGFDPGATLALTNATRTTTVPSVDMTLHIPLSAITFVLLTGMVGSIPSQTVATTVKGGPNCDLNPGGDCGRHHGCRCGGDHKWGPEHSRPAALCGLGFHDRVRDDAASSIAFWRSHCLVVSARMCVCCDVGACLRGGRYGSQQCTHT